MNLWEIEITGNFVLGEFCYLPKLGVMHTPSIEELLNIINLAKRLELIRAVFNRPVDIVSGIRPTKVVCDKPEYKGKDYNAMVGGASDSSHIYAKGADIYIHGISGDIFRHIMIPHLENMDIRLKHCNNKFINHVDIMPVGKNRYFLP